jgi:23S rRNA (guanosine2251-2'-O)-methyltransferase
MWIWGIHAVEAAIKNPNREIYEVIATKNAAAHLPEGAKTRVVEPEYLSDALPPNSVHQGLAARVKPLPDPDYDAVLKDGKLVFILDQLTDPQNIGSIFRTAAAFGASAIIQQDRKAPTITGALAKAAQGGVEIVPDLRVVNISQTLVELSEQGWMCIGLDMEGSAGTLAKVLEGEKRPVAIVLGAEGKGIRPLVAERCDTIAHIPMPGNMESLNVSNAAAIAAYEVIRGK